jgi:hypothetical protein
MVTINIAKDFTKTPGHRYKEMGMFSGEEFREKFLDPLFTNDNINSDETILIILDGGYGYCTGFLEESFGGLVRKFGYEKTVYRFKFISEEEPDIINKILNYMEDSR